MKRARMAAAAELTLLRDRLPLDEHGLRLIAD
jgi:hypothetical protein